MPHWRIPTGSSWLELGQRTLVMGILNITPDSFSDGGRYLDIDAAVAHAHEMIADGADLLDIGGESTRPHHTPVSAEEEMHRVLPVLERLARDGGVPISIDTTKATVARQALAAGATIINDQWGLQRDPQMAAVAAEYNVPVIVMHNQHGTQYTELMADIIAFLRHSIALAEEAGVSADRLIMDPGVGFGKTPVQNLEVLRRLPELQVLDRPILIGTSRKSTIGKVLGGLPPDQRLEGTAATVALGIAAGVDIVRVHDVKQMARVARMADAIVRPGRGGWQPE